MSRSRSISSLPIISLRFGNNKLLRQAYSTWLDSLSNWTHAVTLTCKRNSHKNNPIRDEILIDAAKHVIRLINHKCFGKASKKHSIALVATYGWGVYDLHPHLHFCFECPAHMPYEEFSTLIEEAASETYWIDRQICIKPYKSEGWTSYLVKHGTDYLIVPLIHSSASSTA